MRETEPSNDDGRLGRREFLGLGAAVAGTALLGGAGCSSDEPAPVADLGSWAGVRDLFNLEPNLLHFASFLLASHPRQVREAIQKHRGELDANPVEYLHANEGRLEQRVREAAGTYLRASADDIALTDSTTMGLALMYRGLRLRPGDEIVTTEHDFYATHVSLRAAARRTGAAIRVVRLYDDPATASRERIVSSIARALTPRTRCVAVTWVHSSTGVKLPLRDIAAVARAANRSRPERERVLLCVDGVHGFGVEETSPAELGCDMFAAGCHKWLFGPRGTGLLWGRPAAWRRLEPTIPSFDGRAYEAWMNGESAPDGPPGPLLTPGGFHSFEHRWALVGGARPARTDRAAADRRAHPQPRAAAEGRLGCDPARAIADAARRAPVVRARLLRAARPGSEGCRRTPPLRARGGCQRHALPHRVRSSRPEHPQHARGGRPSARRDPFPLTRATHFLRA